MEMTQSQSVIQSNYYNYIITNNYYNNAAVLMLQKMDPNDFSDPLTFPLALPK